MGPGKVPLPWARGDTILAMGMFVGPVVGYLMGHYVEVRLGGEPYQEPRGSF